MNEVTNYGRLFALTQEISMLAKKGERLEARFNQLKVLSVPLENDPNILRILQDLSDAAVVLHRHCDHQALHFGEQAVSFEEQSTKPPFLSGPA